MRCCHEASDRQGQGQTLKGNPASKPCEETLRPAATLTLTALQQGTVLRADPAAHQLLLPLLQWAQLLPPWLAARQAGGVGGNLPHTAATAAVAAMAATAAVEAVEADQRGEALETGTAAEPCKQQPRCST